MTCRMFHAVSRMRENCTFGSMMGRRHPAGAARFTLQLIESAICVPSIDLLYYFTKGKEFAK